MNFDFMPDADANAAVATQQPSQHINTTKLYEQSSKNLTTSGGRTSQISAG